MIDSIFILSGLGEVIIEKHYRHGTSRAQVADLFWEHATRRRDGDDLDYAPQGGAEDGEDGTAEDVPPVLQLGSEPGRFAVHVKRGDLTYVAGISRETSPMMALEFLFRVGDVLAEYLGEPDEVKIKDAFSTVYQILDEMADGGLPLVTEPHALKKMIEPPTVANKVKAVVMGGAAGSMVNPVLPVGAVSTNPWRDKSVQYLQNEIFVDVEEYLDLVTNNDDELLGADVRGSIKCTTRLSGMPEVLISFDDPEIFSDVAFHPCVRVERWEREKVLSLVPPDGSFELMTYRVHPRYVSKEAILEAVPFYCRPSVTCASTPAPENPGLLQGRLEILVGPRRRFSSIPSTISSSPFNSTQTGSFVDGVIVRVPLPPSSKFLECKANEGKSSFSDRTCVWQIGKLDLAKTALRLTGSFAIPIQMQQQQGSTSFSSPKAAISTNQVLSTTSSLEFTFTAKPVSGLRVTQLEITNMTYKYFKGVKSVLKAGEFQIRS